MASEALARAQLVKKYWPVGFYYDGGNAHAVIWYGTEQRQTSQMANIRGWGYLTGGGGCALGLSNEEAARRQDAVGELFVHAAQDIIDLSEKVAALRTILSQIVAGGDPWSKVKADEGVRLADK